jgi:hypothetical protein
MDIHPAMLVALPAILAKILALLDAFLAAPVALQLPSMPPQPTSKPSQQ